MTREFDDAIGHTRPDALMRSAYREVMMDIIAWRTLCRRSSVAHDESPKSAGTLPRVMITGGRRNSSCRLTIKSRTSSTSLIRTLLIQTLQRPSGDRGFAVWREISNTSVT
jgi:hypothetical protein